jgi:molybdate transport system substrate-binding protein
MTAADVGFIAASVLHSPKMLHFQKGLNYIDLDSSLYTPISQGIVLLKNATNNKEAKLFYKFLLSDKAKEIFRHFGYTVV